MVKLTIKVYLQTWRLDNLKGPKMGILFFVILERNCPLDLQNYNHYFGVDKKQRITKPQNHKTATTTKQRLLQNGNCYKTKTAKSQNGEK